MKTTWCALVPAALLLAGCKSDLNQQLLERELRYQEDQIYQLQDELQAACARLDCARHAVIGTHSVFPPQSRPPTTSTHARPDTHPRKPTAASHPFRSALQSKAITAPRPRAPRPHCRLRVRCASARSTAFLSERSPLRARTAST